MRVSEFERLSVSECGCACRTIKEQQYISKSENLVCSKKQVASFHSLGLPRNNFVLIVL